MTKYTKEKTKGTELIYGNHPILELFAAKRRKLVILYTTKPEPKAWDQIEPLLTKNIQIQYVHRDVLTKLAGIDRSSRICWLHNKFSYQKKFFEAAKQPFLLLLDGIQDARNLGAILRSAYCTNVNGVIITQKGSAPMHAATFRLLPD